MGYIASKVYDIESIDDRIRKFIEIDIVQWLVNIAICYSPHDSHLSRNQCEAFVQSGYTIQLERHQKPSTFNTTASIAAGNVATHETILSNAISAQTYSFCDDVVV